MAIALKILIPPGFMAAVPSNTAPFAIVLCTGQGAMTIAPGQAIPGHDGQEKAPTQSRHDMPCAFAGHGLGVPPAGLREAGPTQFVAYLQILHSTAPDLAPGRGLAGPPLPARGPPSQLI